MPETPALSHRASSQTETDEPQLAFEVPPNVLGDVDVMAGGGNKKALDSSATESDSTGESEFREGGYGWVVVLSVLLVNAHTWGLNSSYAVFLAYYLRSGAIAGASPLAFAFVGGLSISIAFLVSPLATLCIGRFGTKATLRIGVGLEAVSFIGASFTSQAWHLLLSQGICFGTGMGFCFTATVGVVPQWFTKRRSLANAISTSGSGFGGLMYSLATNAMISNLGLPWAFRILAILAFVVNGVCSLLVRDRNKAVGSVHVAFHGALFRRLEFWLFLGWGFFSIISYIIVVFSLTDYSQHVGFSASQGSLVAALFNLSQGLGRILIGFIGDRFGIMNVAGLGTLVAGLAALFIWILAGQHYAGAVVYALFGIVAGIIWPTVAPVGVEVIGLQLLPSALSIYWLVLVLPATFAEVIGLSMRKPGVDGYIDVQVFTGILYLVSFVSIWLLRSWKLRQIEALIMEGEHQVASTPRKGDAATVTPGGAEKKPAIVQEPGLLRAYLTNMFAIKRV
ncbi:major facilitator superfamily domain-containing protein [Diplogelasinospora grovesii]|uniref:Major facilitator superfamily domain-containing protein n=1 Tax=Diplogelasinospora grovesii TaxID=303347 RepID=A0AAN6NGB7_9PEZI|nr:major facilitator superfamily domain-containing protein [Diplogelasinospora grovesii]